MLDVDVPRARGPLSFHPGLWLVSGSGSAGRTDIGLGRLGWEDWEDSDEQKGNRSPEAKTWPFQLARLHRELK